ncbi:hypothetical protein E2C01_085345 [Portunus trituberculatus]|uniref:Uncharacterized protein n=1 Tax=Portunus trituberculatus TaxID=210409 RepID=A0A5B7JDC7_PORTR|nr:hypothetical protein [Portunus trituberculatus]
MRGRGRWNPCGQYFASTTSGLATSMTSSTVVKPSPELVSFRRLSASSRSTE